jgi:hypothetical protein
MFRVGTLASRYSHPWQSCQSAQSANASWLNHWQSGPLAQPQATCKRTSIECAAMSSVVRAALVSMLLPVFLVGQEQQADRRFHVGVDRSVDQSTPRAAEDSRQEGHRAPFRQ